MPGTVFSAIISREKILSDRNTKDFAEYGLWMGGLDVSSKNIDQFDPLRTGFARLNLRYIFCSLLYQHNLLMVETAGSHPEKIAKLLLHLITQLSI